MSTFVRASKYRHVFCEAPKQESIYSNIRLSTVTGEQNYIKANHLYFACGLQGGGGPFAVVPLTKPGRFEAEQPIVTGHSAAVLDFDFNPFHENILASCGEDMTVKIWQIPEGGLSSNLEIPAVDLHGHARKVTLLKFHPTASNILASTSGDFTAKLWDIEKGAEINSFTGPEQLIQDIVWDYTGSNYAISNKDKHVRIIDARTGALASTIQTAHEGSKSTKLAYLGPLEKIVTVGFTRQSQRQMKFWDPRNTSAALKSVDIDQAAGVIMPFYDPDTSLLFLVGKGDCNIRFYEIVGETPYCYPVSNDTLVRATPAKGMAMVPKYGLNVMACETSRLLKLTSNSVEPLSYHVPRKSDAFQDDIYPDTASMEPAHTADEWLAGSNLPPKLMSLNPAIRRSGGAAAGGASAPAKSTFTVAKSAAVLQTELDAALARIKVLEERLTAAGLSVE